MNFLSLLDQNKDNFIQTIKKINSRTLGLTTIPLTSLLAACSFDGNDTPEESPPTVVSSNVADMAADVTINSQITATFNEAKDPATVNDLSFTVVAENAPR